MTTTNTNTAIAQAVEPLRVDAVSHAAKVASEIAERTLAKFEAGEITLDLTVDQIYSMGRTEKALHAIKADQVRSLTIIVREPGKPARRVRDAQKVADFIEQAKASADAHYTSFIQKLEKKAGEHTAASLEGNHVWFSSVLTVTKADGSTEKWFTQQINNVSKLGRPFPQWPSRKVK